MNIKTNHIEKFNKNLFKSETSCIILSSLFTIATIGLIIMYLYNSNILILNNFKDRTIGIAILSGVNASLRTYIYIGLMITSIIIFFIYLFLISFIFKIYYKQKYEILSNYSLEHDQLSNLRNSILYISIFSLILLILYIVTGNTTFFNGFGISLFFFIWIGLVNFIKYIPNIKYYNKKYELLKNENVIIAFLILPYDIICIFWVIFNQNFIITKWYIIYYNIILILLFIGYHILIKYYNKYKVSKSQLDDLIILSGLPITLIPLTIPLSNELQYTISGTWHIPPIKLSELILLILISASIALIFFYRIRQIKLNSQAIIANFYFPLTLASVLLFKLYQPILIISNYDMFHIGEKLISNQQLFLFKSIPFVNIYPTHGLSEISYQLLYSLVNGYRPIEPLLWSWIPSIIGVILVYFVLKEIVDPVFAFLTILLTPIISLCGNNFDYYYYLFGFLPALSLAWLLKKRTFSRYVIHWIIIFFMMLWRFDFGVASAVATLFILLIVICSDILNKKLNFKLELIMSSLSLIFVVCISCFAFISLVILGKESLYNIIIQILEFVQFQDPVAAYSSILPPSFPSQTITIITAIIQYTLLPAVSIFYIIYFIYIIFLKNKIFYSHQIMLLFLAIFSLIMSVRSVGRHSLIETYNQYLFIFLAICIPFYIKIKKQYIAVLFSAGILLTYLLFMNMLSIHLGCLLVIDYNDKFFEFHDWVDKESRLIDDKSQYINIINFINTSLQKNQTFFDFTNSPMLYIFTDKKFEPYIIPNLYQTSEPIQDIMIKRLEKEYSNQNIPIVIFKQNNWWDYVDMVPNEIRSYRIAEFIYNNYKPVGNVGDYQIWVADNSNILGNVSYNSYNIDIDNSNIILNNASVLSDENLIVNCNSIDPYFFNFLNLSSAIYRDNNSYLSLTIEYKCSIDGTLQIFYSYNNISFSEDISSRVSIHKTINNSSIITVPLIWNKGRLTNIRFDPPDGSTFEVISIKLYESPYGFIPYSQMSQEFNLQKLPYIWGTYDPYKASKNTKVIEIINSSQVVLSKGQSINLTFNPEIDKSTGNYIHLKIKSENSTIMKISYGINSTSIVTFEVISSTTYNDYLIRISTQWGWMNEPINKITLKPYDTVDIGSVIIRKGD